MGEPRLVLWDIDQTLLEGGGGTKDAYAAAFQNATGRQLRHPWSFDGRTERAAATEVLRSHGLTPDDGLLERFLDNIVSELHDRCDHMVANGRVLAGAAAALRELGARSGVYQSVLTGNLYSLAVLKLTVFGLDRHVDLRIGAFGGDALDRRDLPRHAFARAAQHLGLEFTGARTVIIGDTRRDIEAAHAVGARAIGVATGYTSATELRAAGAHVVLADLRDTASVVRAIASDEPDHVTEP